MQENDGMNASEIVTKELSTNTDEFSQVKAIHTMRIHKNHPLQSIMGDLNQVKTLLGIQNTCFYPAFLSQEEPKNE